MGLRLGLRAWAARLRGAEDAGRKEEDGSDEREGSGDGEADEAEGEKDEPDEGVEDQGDEGDGPAGDEEDAEEEKLDHGCSGRCFPKDTHVGWRRFPGGCCAVCLKV